MLKHLQDNPAGGASIKRVADSWTIGCNTASPEDIPEITGLSDSDVLERIGQIRQDRA
ncbi:hypothetical protein [Arthrobacter sp. E3]|uniref:hypothetical protein n=1 Tax=Arthrobacter sp. E3 TaxID=517402 RepID=UPI001FFD2863|nr:hypothetical protein [Arthrobacter sp. E3]